MKKLDIKQKRRAYGGFVHALMPLFGTLTNGFLTTSSAAAAAASLPAMSSSLLAQTAPLAATTALTAAPWYSSTETEVMDLISKNKKGKQTQEVVSTSKFANKKQGFLKKAVKNMTDYGGWNSAMLVGSGVSVATGLATNALNIAESLKEQPKYDPYLELGPEPLMHARFF